ncbi:MAG: hypothetical protein M3024_10860 [Candidatus Dormibacteraeota bacterium]|nr:hypothetical protein [Candidatus Dormibacteraeota bacterium]
MALVAPGGHISILIAVLVLVLLPAVIWRWPQVMPVSLLLVACLVEQFPTLAGGAFTNSIRLFTSLQDGMGIPHVAVNPMELLLALFVIVYLLKVVPGRRLVLPRSLVTYAVLAMLLIALVATVYGLLSGGSSTFALWELRPWVYLAAAYFFGAMLVTDARIRRAMLWAFIIGTGIKGLQGTANFLTTFGNVNRPEAILAHEEAFFFGVYAVFVAALWVWGEKGRMRFWATALLPTVLLSDISNHRRAAWLIIGAGLILLLVVAWLRQPQRRPVITKAVIVLMAVGAAYTAAFWNQEGNLAQPARAVRSVVAPDARDTGSNQYRVLEDANLELNIRQSFPIGKGFGVPINYAIPIIDISNTDALIKYVTHDGVLYVWMRMGLEGMFAFWFLIGAAMISAARLARHSDRDRALVAFLVLAVLAGYVLEGQYDYGLFWFRMALFVGLWIGTLEGLRAAALPVPARALARVGVSRRLRPAMGLAQAERVER